MFGCYIFFWNFDLFSSNKSGVQGFNRPTLISTLISALTMCELLWNILFILLYCIAHIFLDGTGFVDFQVVFVGDAVVLDTTEWASAGGG